MGVFSLLWFGLSLLANSNYWLLLSNYSTDWERRGNGLGEIVCEGIGICEFSH